MSGRKLNLSFKDMDIMSERINSIDSEHMPKAGVMFYEKPIAKAGHNNTLVDYMDAPKIGDFGETRTRELFYKGKIVKGLFADIEDMPEGAYRMYKGGAFPSVSAEISPNYLGQGPMIRAAALQGMVPPALKGQPKLDIFSQLFSEGEELEKIASTSEKNKIDLFTLNFSEFGEIQEENSMNPDEIKKLVADSIAAAMSGLGKGIKNDITAQFAEYFKKDDPPTRSKEDQEEMDKLNADIKRRDTEARNGRVVRFGEALVDLKECEEHGQKKGLPPVLMDDIKAFGTALADPEAGTVKFAEGDAVNLLEAFTDLVKKVASAKPLNFSEIKIPDEDKSENKKSFEAGASVHDRFNKPE